MAPRQTASALSVGNAARPDAALLLRVSGPDHPGITADLMALLGVAEVDVQDVEQVLVRGHLTLAVAGHAKGAPAAADAPLGCSRC